MPTFSFDGTNIHYRQQGHEHQPVVLVLPGNSASSAHHAGELAFFASLGYRVIAIDYPGTGQSDRLPRPWPVDWFERNAAACAALLDHVQEESALVCGTSGGAIVALWMAILFPSRVRAVIADSEAVRFTDANFRALEADRAQRSPGQVEFWSGGHGADWQAVVDADTEMFLTIEQQRAINGTWEIHQGRLNEVRCPVLLTCALTDNLVPDIGPQMMEMAAQVPGSHFFAVNRGGHPLMWSCPEEFQSAVRAFLHSMNR